MELDEWRDSVSYINCEISSLIRAQQVHCRIRRELEARDPASLEEDFIDAHLSGDVIGAPKRFEVEGVFIIVRKLHRGGLHASDVAGADLLYEIEDQKFAIIQYKKANGNGRISLESDQLETLIDNCPTGSCNGKGIWPRCGSWYAVRSGETSLYLQACEARNAFGGAALRGTSAFASGLSKEALDELFALCLFGAPISPIGMGAAIMSGLNADHVLFTVSQRGRLWLIAHERPGRNVVVKSSNMGNTLCVTP